MISLLEHDTQHSSFINYIYLRFTFTLQNELQLLPLFSNESFEAYFYLKAGWRVLCRVKVNIDTIDAQVVVERVIPLFEYCVKIIIKKREFPACTDANNWITTIEWTFSRIWNITSVKWPKIYPVSRKVMEGGARTSLKPSRVTIRVISSLLTRAKII